MIKVTPLSPQFGLLIEGDGQTTLDSLDLIPYFNEFNKAEGGALLFRGFKSDIQGFRNVTEKYGKDFKIALTNLDEREYPDQDYSLATVNEGFYAINFHTETNIPYNMNIFWMYCVQPAKEKGRTGIVDGVKVLNELTQSTIKHFEQEGGYWSVSQIGQEEWEHFFPGMSADQMKEHLAGLESVYAVELDDKNSLSFRFEQPPINKTAFCQVDAFIARILDWPEHVLRQDGTQYPKDIITEVNQAVYKHAIWLDWQPGDFLVVNNTRAMHAREAFEDPERQLLVRYSDIAEGVFKNSEQE
ncbi:MAG: TauD/TfdA family dioxygenase [Alteromonadaceae bacterium]|nr:TauD/TfdA family dioxygenase [Alteromonadaceae bacterium]